MKEKAPSFKNKLSSPLDYLIQIRPGFDPVAYHGNYWGKGNKSVTWLTGLPGVGKTRTLQETIKLIDKDGSHEKQINHISYESCQAVAEYLGVVPANVQRGTEQYPYIKVDLIFLLAIKKAMEGLNDQNEGILFIEAPLIGRGSETVLFPLLKNGVFSRFNFTSKHIAITATAGHIKKVMKEREKINPIVGYGGSKHVAAQVYKIAERFLSTNPWENQPTSGTEETIRGLEQYLYPLIFYKLLRCHENDVALVRNEGSTILRKNDPDFLNKYNFLEKLNNNEVREFKDVNPSALF